MITSTDLLRSLPSTFSESDARETLEVAVLEECSKSSLGVSRIVGPLRRVEAATGSVPNQVMSQREHTKTVWNGARVPSYDAIGQR